MKNIKSSLAASLLIIGGLIFSLCQNGIITSSVSAESNNAPRPSNNSRRKDEKISDTLRGRRDELVQVIIQLNSAPTGRLNGMRRLSCDAGRYAPPSREGTEGQGERPMNIYSLT